MRVSMTTFQSAELTAPLDELNASPDARERAWGHNFLFETRLSAERLASFEQLSIDVQAAIAADPAAPDAIGRVLLGMQNEYYNININVALRIPHTFLAMNSPAAYDKNIESNQWLIRVEWIDNPLAATGTDFDKLKTAFDAGDRRDVDERAYIDSFLDEWNALAKRKPQFAALETETREDIEEADWFDRLRTRLGLAHMAPRNGKSVCVALMSYRVADVQKACAGFKDIVSAFTSPTVLDQGPWEYFFPSPKTMIGGRTMPLEPQLNYLRLVSEILHPKFNYEIQHIQKLLRVDTGPPVNSIKKLRNSHLECLHYSLGDEQFGFFMKDDVND
jgi:hypothetical protein